jgi:hypothetical protein
LVLLAISSFSGGCTGSVGTLVTRCRLCRAALAQEVYAVGFEIRNRPQEVGLNLGYRHSVYIYPLTSANISLASNRWRWFAAPALPERLAKEVRTQAGLEICLTPIMAGLEIGYGQSAVSSYSLLSSEMVAVKYTQAHPEQTEVVVTRLPE